MLTVAIETSGRRGSVALVRNGTCLIERALNDDGRRPAQTLVSEMDRLFREFDSRPKDCDLICVSLGPGSFTGLRVGVVCAKTFAYATGARIVGVETLLAVAANSPPEVDEVTVVADAQRGELFVGRYHRRAPDGFDAAGSTKIVAVNDWLATLAAEDVVTGPGLEKIGTSVATRCQMLDRAFWSPRASVIAFLGETRLREGMEPDDPWKLEPRYLRKSAAEEKRDAVERSANGTP